MATGKKGGGPEKPPQEDRIIARLAGDSTQVTTGLTSYIGLLGRSPKEGYWLLYPSLDMSTSVEIREEDIVHSDQLPPDKSPFGSLGGTQVFVRKDAQVTTTRTISRTHAAGGDDEFDLDIKLGGGGGGIPLWCHATATTCVVCPGDGGGGGGGGGEGGGGGGEEPGTESCFKTCHTCRTDCNQATCNTCTCQTKCGQPTCNTCQTKCGQATCNNTCQTCQTKCGQQTCHTCQTKCGQATCGQNTCHTCGQDTCITCGACFTKDATCFNTCDC
jgi:hypothetical protein